MKSKRDKIIYYAATGLFTASMSLSIVMYFFANDMASEAFTKLGFPTFIIYPLAIAKLLGLVAIWTGKSKLLKEWAYAGFFFNLVLAVTAHVAINDGEFAPAAIALLMLLISYIFGKKLNNVPAK